MNELNFEQVREYDIVLTDYGKVSVVCSKENNKFFDIDNLYCGDIYSIVKVMRLSMDRKRLTVFWEKERGIYE